MPPLEPPVIADHPALDFLNTVVQVETEPYDFLQSDDDVLRWLGKMDFLQAEPRPSYKPQALMCAARALRDVIRRLVAERKSGHVLDIAALNAFLEGGRYTERLVRHEDGTLQIEYRYGHETPEQLLAPLARSAAELLVTGNFDLVRTCESTDCSLCFYDRTKSHRRRWCSMALCGNRHKVASFRKRQEK